MISAPTLYTINTVFAYNPFSDNQIFKKFKGLDNKIFDGTSAVDPDTHSDSGKDSGKDSGSGDASSGDAKCGSSGTRDIPLVLRRNPSPLSQRRAKMSFGRG